MDWDKLQNFLIVARQGTLARAARMMGVDATTVSRRVSALEQALQQTLFERTATGFLLTEAGRALVPHAESMAAAAARIHAAESGEAALSGQLRVAVTEGFGTRFVAPRIAAFASLYPRITVDLFANSGFLSPSRKEADIAILLAQPRKGPLKTRKLTDYLLGLYVRVDASPDDLPLISYIPDVVYAPELDYLGELALDREATIRSSSINAQAAMIATGAGFGVLPCFMGDSDARLRRIRPEMAIQRSFWLTVHQDVSPLPRVRCFTDWLVDIVAGERGLLLGGAR